MVRLDCLAADVAVLLSRLVRSISTLIHRLPSHSRVGHSPRVPALQTQGGSMATALSCVVVIVGGFLTVTPLALLFLVFLGAPASAGQIFHAEVYGVQCKAGSAGGLLPCVSAALESRHGAQNVCCGEQIQTQQDVTDEVAGEVEWGTWNYKYTESFYLWYETWILNGGVPGQYAEKIQATIDRAVSYCRWLWEMQYGETCSEVRILDHYNNPLVGSPDLQISVSARVPVVGRDDYASATIIRDAYRPDLSEWNEASIIIYQKWTDTDAQSQVGSMPDRSECQVRAESLTNELLVGE